MGGQTSPGNYQYLGSPQEGLYPKRPIPRIRPTEALIAIQTMANHSQKWHDGTTSMNIQSSSSKDRLAALVNKLDNLGRDMKKLKESVHAIQVGCQICEGPHLDKDCPLNEKVKQVEECFQGNSACENNPTHRSFDDYKWEFNLEINKLADEYELGIGKKGRILDHVWEYCNQVHNKNYEWHNYKFENEECEEIGIEDKEYHPPEVQVETFENPEAKSQFSRPARSMIIGNLVEIAAANHYSYDVTHFKGIQSLREDGDNLIDFCLISNLEAMLREFLLNTAYPLPPDTAYLTFFPIQLRMTKVIKGEFEKIKDVKVEDVSLTCDTPLKVFNKEVSRLSGMDNDLLTYEVEVANILCNLKINDDSEHEADDDMGYDPSDVAFAEWIDTNIFDYETPLCSAFNEFNYLLKVDPDLLTKDIMGFKTYEDYKDDWIYEWNKDVPWVYDKPWLDNGIWKDPTPVKHSCKPFNYKTGCSEWPTYSWMHDVYLSKKMMMSHVTNK
ncbi:hypothetical protein Tco_0703017 [Tanacetum coccineum]|uniref:Uncharacterized protein n=1 Tax=Tanacetum coccineum TaxID=301880 RepID=A0ABQ4XYH0_9ASTR